MKPNYDFSGYVTKYNILCYDGRILAPEAFKDCDGKIVPLVSTLFPRELYNVIGSITLQHRFDGVYGYGQFNDSQLAKTYQELVESHAIGNLCIHANKLKEKDHIVTFGVIQAVSIASSGTNPEAYIDCIINKNKENNADKLYPDCMTKNGTLAISQSQIANAPTVEPKLDYLHHDSITKSDTQL